MAVELPRLPDRMLRLHSLRWKELIEKHGFTGEHLKWHESPDRRRRAARPRFSLAPPPLIPVTHTTTGAGTIHGIAPRPVPHEEWLEKEMEACVRRESDPQIIDSIGVAETVMLAKARFQQVIIDYLQLWAGRTNPDSDEFRQWSIGIAQSVAGEVGDLWRKDEWHSNWFERACHKKVEEAFGPLTREWGSRASTLEIQSLAHPDLTIEFLLAADGNLNLARTLNAGQRTIEKAQQVLSNLRGTESLIPPNEQIRAGQHERAGLPGPQREGNVVPQLSRAPQAPGVGHAQPVRTTSRTLPQVTESEACRAATTGKKAGEQVIAVPSEAESQSAARCESAGQGTHNRVSGHSSSAPETAADNVEQDEPGASMPAADAIYRSSDRLKIVDDFVDRCNRVSGAGSRIAKKHIWLAAGYTNARQFQYWQAGKQKVTESSERNFGLILAMEPADFCALLKERGIMK